jgi:hypothetical protein
MKDSSLFIHKNEKTIFILICVLSIIKLFAFNAAYPFFNNVDEQEHFDLVVKYARGYLPTKDNTYFDHESIKYIARYWSPEYFVKTDLPSGFRIPPELEAQQTKDYLNIENFESNSPPIYYAIAGVWYDIGKLLGIHDGYLLYWIRFLNLPIYALLILTSYLFCKFIDHKDTNLRLGVILLLVFIPQDIFYSINNDVLSPLFFLISLYLLLKICLSDCNLVSYFAAGCMVAATILVKLSNLPIIAIFCIMFIYLINKYYTTKQILLKMPYLIILLLSFLIPIIIWSGYNYLNFGDFTGTTSKIIYLGWQPKEFNQLLNHPIFTIHGFIYFISNTIKSFWRGEFIWKSQVIKSEVADILYITTSVAFYMLGMWDLLFNLQETLPWRRLCRFILVCTPILFILYLFVISIRFDFGVCYYPSRNFPFMCSGRLILGALVPFLIIYIKGIECLSSKIRNNIAALSIILLIGISITYLEITETYNAGVFSSPLNFFHL